MSARLKFDVNSNKLEGTVPGVIGPHMSEDQYQSFKRECDECMVPVTELGSKLKMLRVVYAVVVVIGVIIGPGAAIGCWWGERVQQGCEQNMAVVFALMIIPVALIIGLCVLSSRLRTQKIKEGLAGVGQVCAKYSQEVANVTFVVKTEQVEVNDGESGSWKETSNYIEVKVAGGGEVHGGVLQTTLAAPSVEAIGIGAIT